MSTKKLIPLTDDIKSCESFVKFICKKDQIPPLVEEKKSANKTPCEKVKTMVQKWNTTGNESFDVSSTSQKCYRKVMPTKVIEAI